MRDGKSTRWERDCVEPVDRGTKRHILRSRQKRQPPQEEQRHAWSCRDAERRRLPCTPAIAALARSVLVARRERSLLRRPLKNADRYARHGISISFRLDFRRNDIARAGRML